MSREIFDDIFSTPIFCAYHFLIRHASLGADASSTSSAKLAWEELDAVLQSRAIATATVDVAKAVAAITAAAAAAASSSAAASASASTAASAQQQQQQQQQLQQLAAAAILQCAVRDVRAAMDPFAPRGVWVANAAAELTVAQVCHWSNESPKQ